MVLASSPGLAERRALVAAPAPPVDSLEVVSPGLAAVLSLEVVPLAVVDPEAPLSANFAFSSSLAFTAFYFSKSFYFLASVALLAAADVAVGFISLDGPLSPPAPPRDVPSLSSTTPPFASKAAFFSASFKAYLSRSVSLGYLVGDTFLSSFGASAVEDVEDFVVVEDTILDLLALSSSATVVFGLSSRTISFFSSTFSLST